MNKKKARNRWVELRRYLKLFGLDTKGYLIALLLSFVNIRNVTLIIFQSLPKLQFQFLVCLNKTNFNIVLGEGAFA